MKPQLRLYKCAVFASHSARELPDLGEPGWRSAEYLALTSADREEGAMGVESERIKTFGKLEDGLRQASDWYLWGPDVSQRQWGTVREDYSEDGEAWNYFPTITPGRGPIAGARTAWPVSAMSNNVSAWDWHGGTVATHLEGEALRPYGVGGQPRRGREGLLVVPRCRAQPRVEPLAVPLPPVRLFRTRTPVRRTPGGASGTPSTSCSIPVPSTKTGTGSSKSTTPRMTPTTSSMSVQVTNAGPEADTLHVLPSVWFRNTWSWDFDAPKPELAVNGPASVGIRHPFLGELELGPGRPRRGGTDPALL